ncbi:MAG: hypothetical protein L0387_30355 [Acidobacteria bacterium]|nr:hypothetical protein [Acidobacteriota bacterium]
MPKLKNVEKRIWDIEGFAVIIRHSDGRDMRGDSTGIPQYNHFERMAKNDMTVADWKFKRFYTVFPGFDVDVLDGDGSAVAGNTKLGTVRDSYAED